MILEQPITFQERWYQHEAVEKLFDFYSVDRKLVDGFPEPKNAVVCLPTGTGKSLVIAMFIKRCFEMVPNTKVVMSTHVKELIRQNAEKLQQYWPLAPLGIYSAGLHQYDHVQPIIFGGIQSMVGKLKFGHVDFLVIDEAHLVGDDGSYLQFINELKMRNPFLKIIMLTATPYRMGMGLLTNGPIATDIVYNLCNVDGFARLIAEGFLCQLIVPARLAVQLDISGVGFSKGDFIQGQLEEAVDKNDVNYSMLSEYMTYAASRRCGLIFAAGIKHAHHLQEMIQQVFHEECAILHSKMGDKHNDEMMSAWKAGEIKHAVNMNMLTTGVDNPMVDIICDAQPTMSTGKHVQKYGRGTRPFPEKPNCLVLDYGGNTRRLGPINDPVIPRLKGQGPPGDAPIRICPNCGVYNHARASQCVACGLPFATGPIKVCYYCGLRTFYDYKNVEGNNYNGKIGREWFRQIYGEPFEGMTNEDVLRLVSYLRMPRQINMWMNAKPFPKVMNQEF